MENRMVHGFPPPSAVEAVFPAPEEKQPMVLAVPPQQHLTPFPQHFTGQPINSALQNRMVVPHGSNAPYQPVNAQEYSLSYPVPIQPHPAVTNLPAFKYQLSGNCYQQAPATVPDTTESQQTFQPPGNGPSPQCIPVTVQTGNSYYIEYRPVQSSTNPMGVQQLPLEYSLVDSAYYQQSFEQIQPAPPQVFAAQTIVHTSESQGNIGYMPPLNPSHNPPQAIPVMQSFPDQRAVEQPPATLNIRYQTATGHQNSTSTVTAYNPQIPPPNFLPPNGNSTVANTHTTTTNTCSYSNAKIPVVPPPQTVPPPSRHGNQPEHPARPTNQSSILPTQMFTPPQLEPGLKPKRDEYYKHRKTVPNASKPTTRKLSKPTELLPGPDLSRPPSRLKSSNQPAIPDESQHKGTAKKDESENSVEREKAISGLAMSDSQHCETKPGTSSAEEPHQLLQQPANQSSTIEKGEPKHKEGAVEQTDRDTDLEDEKPAHQPDSTKVAPPNTPDIQAALTGKVLSVPISPTTKPATDYLSSSAPQHQAEPRKKQSNPTSTLSPNPSITGHSSELQPEAVSFELTDTSMPWMPDIDLATLPAISSSRHKANMDPDIKILYLKHLSSSQLPRGRNSNDYLVQVQDNNNLHYNPRIPKHTERQQILASIVRHMNKTSEYKELKESQSVFIGAVKAAQSKRMAVYSGISSPDYFILMCIGPFLPYTQSHNITLSAQFLPGYCIPFSSTQSLMTAVRKNKEVKDEFGTKVLKELDDNQLASILSVFTIMNATFQIKMNELINNSDREQPDTDRQSDVLLHSKFISHMALTALLYCQHEPSLENISQFISIIGYLLEHITTSRTFYDIASASYLELVRGLLTLLSHHTAIEELSPVILGTLKRQALSESAQSSDSSRQEQQKEKLRKKLQAKNGVQVNPEDTLIRAGKRLTKKLQSELVEILKYCCKKADLTPYYLATLHTIAALPLFNPKLITPENKHYQKLINHLSGFLCSMIDNLQGACQWNTESASPSTVIKSIEAWHPKLDQLLATLAGWQPAPAEKSTYHQWPSMALKEHESKKKQLPPDLLPLVENSIRLKKETLRKKINEDESIRQFEKDADRWAKKIDELNKKKAENISKPHKRQQQKQSSSTTKAEESPERKSEISREQTAEIPTCQFLAKVTDCCAAIDFSKEFKTLQAEAEKHMDGQLSFDSHKLWLYTEMAFQCFHTNRQNIIMTSTAMAAATLSYEKLIAALSKPKGEFANRRQSSDWLSGHFTPSELSPKRLLRLSIETKAEQLESARRSLENSLSLFQLAIKPGLDLVQAMEKPDFIFRGELALEELITHFEMCRDAMQLLTDEFKNPLEQKIITLELPGLKRQLFQQLRLYGPNSFRNTVPSQDQDPSYENAMKALKRMEEHKEEYHNYNQTICSTEKTETDELMNKFTQIEKGLKSFFSRASGVA